MGRNISMCHNPGTGVKPLRGWQAEIHLPRPTLPRPTLPHPTKAMACLPKAGPSRTLSLGSSPSPSTTTGVGGRSSSETPLGGRGDKGRQHSLPVKSDFFPKGLCSV